MGVSCSKTSSAVAAEPPQAVQPMDATVKPTTAATVADSTEAPADSPVTARLELTGEEELGAGTSGAAWLVANHLDGFKYCLKRVPLTDKASRAAAANEAALHARVINHDACVRYCFSWVDEAAPPHFCLLMELCESDLWSYFEAAANRGDVALEEN